MVSVFLSYARGDDDVFVHRVYTELRSRGLTVWWDRECMPSRALTFTEEIRDAIHDSERLLVVIGPRALGSDYVRAEWQAALSEHKPVVPVLRRVPDGVGDPYTCLPSELRHLHAPDFLVAPGGEPSLDPLERILTEPVPTPAPVFGRPPERPPHFRPRPDTFAAVFDAVLGELTSTEVRTHERRVTVLVGMVGIGKTVLAASLVEAMRSRPSTFLEDGVYWLSGPPLSRLAVLCGVSVSDPLDERDTVEALARHLDGKRFLLVVDDATSAGEIAPLVRVLGGGGRMLVTTRHGEVAVGHQRVHVDDLSDEDALQLVADWLGTPVDAVPPEARRMVELCGRHPFAIAVNAASAAQGLAWSTIVTALERNELDFAEHRFEEYVYASVEKSIETSVAALSHEEQARYGELAAFFWDSGVPAPVVARFWARRGGVPGHRAERLLVFLRQRSLLQLRGSPERYEVGLHDLHRAYTQRDEQEVAALAEALLESYQPSEPDAWWSVPDDGYVRGHLVRHLLRSRPVREVQSLLAAEDDEQRNRWYRARLLDAHDGTPDLPDGFAGYVADVQLASDRVPGCLLPLVTASLCSLTRAVPGQLLRAAVTDTRWSLDRGITHARLPAAPEDRARAMVALLPRVEDRRSWLEETLDAIEATDVFTRGELIEELAPVASPSDVLPILRRIVTWIGRASTPFEQAHTKPLVHPVLARVPASQAAAAVEIVEGIGIKAVRLYGALPEPERSARSWSALEDARAHQGDLGISLHAGTVSELAEHLDPVSATPLLAGALAAVRGIEDGNVLRQEALFDLLPHLPAEDQRGVLHELIENAHEEPRLFRRLAAAAPPALHPRIREALEAHDLVWMADAAPAFSGPDREALVDRVLSEAERDLDAVWLLSKDDAALVLAMDDRRLDRATHLIDEHLEGWARVRALIAVARATTSPGRREQAVEHALAAVDTLPRADERERAHRAIAPLLAPHQLADALVAVQRIGEPSALEHVLRLLPYLSEPAAEQALELFVGYAGAVPYATWFDALRWMPPELDGVGLERLLSLAHALADEEATTVLARLAPRVTGSRRPAVVQEVRAGIARIERGRTRFALLLELEDGAGAEEQLAGAASSLRPDDLAQHVAELAPHLSAERREHWVQVLLGSAADGGDVLWRLAPFLGIDQARHYLAALLRQRRPVDALGLFRAMDPELPLLVLVDHPAATAAALAARMAALGETDTAFTLLEHGKDDEITSTALAELAAHLDKDRVVLAESRVRCASLASLRVPWPGGGWVSADRRYLTGRLAPALARVGRVDRALEYARAADAERWRVFAHLAIAETVDGDLRTESLLEAQTVVQELPDVHRSAQLEGVADAIARNQRACHTALSRAIDWARGRPRNQAIEMLTSFAPVAAAVGGTALPDEMLRAIDRVVRWWP